MLIQGAMGRACVDIYDITETVVLYMNYTVSRLIFAACYFHPLTRETYLDMSFIRPDMNA